MIYYGNFSLCTNHKGFLMSNITPMNKEYIYDKNVLISQTDLKGTIIYANKMFCEVSGYKAEELKGQSHSIIRHPDMPKAIFTKMWKTISSGQVWNGLVKNLRKDAQFYWVELEILPIYNEADEINGYMAASKPASRKNILEIQENYNKMLELEV